MGDRVREVEGEVASRNDELSLLVSVSSLSFLRVSSLTYIPLQVEGLLKENRRKGVFVYVLVWAINRSWVFTNVYELLPQLINGDLTKVFFKLLLCKVSSRALPCLLPSPLSGWHGAGAEGGRSITTPFCNVCYTRRWICSCTPDHTVHTRVVWDSPGTPPPKLR